MTTKKTTSEHGRGADAKGSDWDAKGKGARGAGEKGSDWKTEKEKPADESEPKTEENTNTPE